MEPHRRQDFVLGTTPIRDKIPTYDLHTVAFREDGMLIGHPGTSAANTTRNSSQHSSSVPQPNFDPLWESQIDERQVEGEGETNEDMGLDDDHHHRHARSTTPVPPFPQGSAAPSPQTGEEEEDDDTQRKTDEGVLRPRRDSASGQQQQQQQQEEEEEHPFTRNGTTPRVQLSSSSFDLSPSQSRRRISIKDDRLHHLRGLISGSIDSALAKRKVTSRRHTVSSMREDGPRRFSIVSTGSEASPRKGEGESGTPSSSPTPLSPQQKEAPSSPAVTPSRVRVDAYRLGSQLPRGTTLSTRQLVKALKERMISRKPSSSSPSPSSRKRRSTTSPVGDRRSRATASDEPSSAPTEEVGWGTERELMTL